MNFSASQRVEKEEDTVNNNIKFTYKKFILHFKMQQQRYKGKKRKKKKMSLNIH